MPTVNQFNCLDLEEGESFRGRFLSSKDVFSRAIDFVEMPDNVWEPVMGYNEMYVNHTKGFRIDVDGPMILTVKQRYMISHRYSRYVVSFSKVDEMTIEKAFAIIDDFLASRTSR